MVATPLVLLANRWTWQLSSYQNRLRYKKFWTENSWRGRFCWTEATMDCYWIVIKKNSDEVEGPEVQAGLVEQEPWRQPNLNSRNPYEVLARKAWLSAFNMRMIWQCFNQHRTNPCIIHWFGPFPNSPHLRISATSDDWLDTSTQEYKQKSHFLHSVSQFTV